MCTGHKEENTSEEILQNWLGRMDKYEANSSCTILMTCVCELGIRHVPNQTFEKRGTLCKCHFQVAYPKGHQQELGWNW